MKKLLILFFVILNLSILGREVDMEQLKAQNDIMYINGEKEAFTGIARTYFDNGNIKEEIEFKNGMKDGTSKEYARNGSLREEAEFKNGEVNGIRKMYYDSGKLLLSQEWKDNEINGISKDYYENGNLSYESIDINGKKDGFIKFYYEDGTLERETSFKMGIQDGPTRTYFENGQLSSEGNYKNNIQEGKYKEYYENGNIRLTGQYKNGERVGKWIEYHQNGKVSREKIYDENTDEEKKTEGKKQIPPTVELEYNEKKSKYCLKGKNTPYTGEVKTFYDNGNTKSLNIYKDGIEVHSWLYSYFQNEKIEVEDTKNGDISERKLYNHKGGVSYHSIQNTKEDRGEDRMYYENGQLKNITRYVGLTFQFRKKEGLQEEYYENGKLELKAEFKNGTHNGKYEEYYKNGNLYKKGQCKDGEKIGYWEFYSEDGKLKDKRNY